MTPLDEIRVAQADKSKPLRATENRTEVDCALCGGPLSPGTWRVLVLGKAAHTHCAGDKGWTIE